MKVHPDPEVDRMLHEAGDLGVEMLRSKDYTSFLKLLELHFPELLEQIDFDANPLVYVQWLKRLNPVYDQLRTEFQGFLGWLETQGEPEEPNPRTPPPEDPGDGRR